MGSDENSNRDANIVARNVKTIIRELGANCAILIIHHVTKGTGDYRGASAYKGHCDFMLKLKADETDENSAVLEHYKAKHSKALASRKCTRVKHDGFYYPRLEWRDYIAPTLEEKEEQKDDILSLFDEAEEWTIRAMKDDTNLPESTLKRRLGELSNDGKIERCLKNAKKPPGNHNPWVYTRVS